MNRVNNQTIRMYIQYYEFWDRTQVQSSFGWQMTLCKGER